VGPLQWLKQKAQQLGVAEQVVFSGFIPENEKADHFRLADAYVMPSQKEGFGFVSLEAMVCGMPTIGSKLDGGCEALRDGQLGLLVDPEQPLELETAILQALAQKIRQIPPGLEYFDINSFRQQVFEFVDRAFEEGNNGRPVF
jgi:glycosyltransferase involved in cell wall biosynthesis